MLRVTLALTLVLAVAACGTRLNPFNWFGNSTNEQITVNDTGEAADPRQLVAEVLSVSVEATSFGAIVRAAGLPPRQGFWAVDLIVTERTDTAITMEFRVAPPPGPTPAGTPVSREVVTATSLSDGELRGIRSITVIGAQNRRTVRR